MLKIAAKLEKRYPGKILSFYQSGLGNLNNSATRKIYAEQAQVMKKVRHMWVDVMKTPEEWKAYGRKVKAANAKRPASLAIPPIV